MQLNKSVLAFTIILALAYSVSAQWVGSDEPPVEPAQKQVANLGSDRTKPAVPGGPSAVVTAEGEGLGIPPVYAVKQEQIAALKLNKEQEAALKADFPAFVPWTLADYGSRVKYYPYSKRQLPWVISWDYNDKNDPALVITGHDMHNNYIVVLRHEKGGYKVIKWKQMEVEYPAELPVLRLVEKGSITRVHQNCDPIVSKKIRHAGFADMKISVSTDYPQEEWFQSDSANSIISYQESLFPVQRGQITGLKPAAPAAFTDKYLKDISLTANMEKALVKYNKNFKAWENRDYPASQVSGYRYSGASLPYAIKHDLNGDGIDDMILAGHDSDSNMVLELLSGASGYFVSSITSEPCYSSARERKKELDLRPSHVLSLYRNGADFAGLSTDAAKDFWNYNGDVLVGLRTINTCREPEKIKTTGVEEQLCGSAGYTTYGKWQQRLGTEKENIQVYGEKVDSDGYGCLGSDSCRLEVLLPGSK